MSEILNPAASCGVTHTVQHPFFSSSSSYSSSFLLFLTCLPFRVFPCVNWRQVRAVAVYDVLARANEDVSGAVFCTFANATADAATATLTQPAQASVDDDGGRGGQSGSGAGCEVAATASHGAGSPGLKISVAYAPPASSLDHKRASVRLRVWFPGAVQFSVSDAQLGVVVPKTPHGHLVRPLTQR